MPGKGLFILGEGADDERLLNHIYGTNLQHNYEWVQTYRYAQQKSEKISNFIRNISRMGADYLFFADIDLVETVTRKKTQLQETFLGLDDTLVQVVMEIESWYIAGISPPSALELCLNDIPNTNTLTKEQFNNLIPTKFDSRLDFMQEILKKFSFEQAQISNHSFAYFAQRYLA